MFKDDLHFLRMRANTMFILNCYSNSGLARRALCWLAWALGESREDGALRVTTLSSLLIFSPTLLPAIAPLTSSQLSNSLTSAAMGPAGAASRSCLPRYLSGRVRELSSTKSQVKAALGALSHAQLSKHTLTSSVRSP